MNFRVLLPRLGVRTNSEYSHWDARHKAGHDERRLQRESILQPISFPRTALIEGSDKRRFFAVLQMGAIKSPADAVRAAIVAERRGPK
jgi:hypothetical protein